jgi:hypothetical protein
MDNPVQAFFLGLMLAWTPSLVLLAWMLWRESGPDKQASGIHN